MSKKLIVFSKAPQVGRVKTRLATHLSLQQCAELHRNLVLNTLDNCKNIVRSYLQCAIELHCSPSVDHPFFKQCAREFPITLDAQYGDNLGMRMYSALSQALLSSQQVILIGTDCPSLDEDYIQSAFDMLALGHDVVLGPARDGGYVLIGANRICPEIFHDIRWSTSEVLTQTIEKLNALDWSYQLLPTLQDIDTYRDLQDLRKYETPHLSIRDYLPTTHNS